MMNLFFATAFADEVAAPAATAAAQQQPSALMQFLPFILIFVIFYFLMIRPQKKKYEAEQKMNNALQKGDEIYTKSGLIGKISGLTDQVATIELNDNGNTVKILRGSIAGKTETIFKKAEK